MKHNAKIKDADWEESMFCIGTYTGKTATGQKVYGSMNDYYQETRYGKFKVEGKFVGWVEVSKKRMEYTTGSGTSGGEKTALLTEALDKLHARRRQGRAEGVRRRVLPLRRRARCTTTRGGLYWPHRASVTLRRASAGRTSSCRRAASRMNDISVFCHEFGHMLGLPDLYARPGEPGHARASASGARCRNQIGNGRPQHFSRLVQGAARLGQADRDRPAGEAEARSWRRSRTTRRECFKVLVRPDGSEYFLLENRRKKGFDAHLPGEGLLIWRVVEQPADPGGVARRRGADRAARAS